LNTEKTQHQRWILAILISGAFFWCSIVFVEPWLAEGAPAMRKWASGITLFFSPLCHQESPRCWHMGENAMPVCARCLGIYLGFFFGTAALSFLKKWKGVAPPRHWLIFMVLPTGIEFFLELLGLYDGSKILRTLTGATAGFIVPFYLYPALTEVLNGKKTRR
jgi:uncharacterized membrane protein